MQDTWRVNEKLTLNLGLRYDLVTGFADDQAGNLIYEEMQAAGRAGVFERTGLPCPCPGFEDFGQEPKEDTNNFAPRVGFTFDPKADGKLVLRGGAGRYYDFAYTNANILFPVYGAQVPFGQIYSNTNSTGVRNADGTVFAVGQPLPPNQLLNVTRPIPSRLTTPRPRQPYTDQANLGFSKEFGGSYAVEVDGVYASGQDFGLRPRLNVRINAGPRRFLGILPQTGGSNFRVYLPEGVNHYKGVDPRVQEALGRQAAGAGQLHAVESQLLGQPPGHRRVRRLRRDQRLRPLRRCPGGADPHGRPPPRHGERGAGIPAGASRSRPSSATGRRRPGT